MRRSNDPQGCTVNQVRALGFVCAGLLASQAAHAKLPAYMEDAAGQAHPEFPTSAYICYAASADDQENAAKLAKSGVARQVRSSIKSTSKTMLERTSDGTNATQKERFWADVSMSASFERADLIEVIEHAKHKRQWYAYACLDREAGSDAILQSVRHQLADHAETVQRARKAWSGGDAQQFSVAYRDASGTFVQIRDDLLVAQSLWMAGDAAQKADDAHEWMVRTANKVIAQTSIALFVQSDTLNVDQQRAVAATYREALSSLDIAASNVTAECSDSTGWQLTVDVDGTTRWGSLGYSAKPAFATVLMACPENRVLASDTFVFPNVQGRDGRGEDRALQEALDKLHLQHVLPELYRMLSVALPLGEM